jgi:hypothetical protein
MMFIPRILLAQTPEQSIPGVTQLAPNSSPGTIPAPGAGLLDQLWGAVTNSSEDSEIPAALNKLWKISMEGGMYRTICFLGTLIAVLAVGFWCVKLYKTLEEGGLRPAANEMVFPVLLIVMLSNNGKNMRDLTLATRDAMNGFNVTLNRVIDAEVSFRSATSVLANFDAAVSFTDGQVKACQSETEFKRFEDCMTQNATISKVFNTGLERLWPEATNKEGAQWQKEIQDWKDYTSNYTKNRFDVSKLNGLKGGNITDKLADIRNIHSFEDTAPFRGVILSFRGAFLYIIEVMMLITALIGPIFLALSLFPVGSKPIVTWGISFLTLGFCKICFSLISGLSSMAMVLAGPNNVDMMVTAVVLGLLAPVLAISVASGSGLATLSSVSQSAQGFGFNSGVGFYNLGSGKGSPPSPDSQSREVK